MVHRIIQAKSRPQILPITMKNKAKLKHWCLTHKIQSKSRSLKYLLKSLLL